MSYTPTTLAIARDYLHRKTGLSLAALGVVGDPAHGGEGYHVGWDRLRSAYGRNDYSVNQSPRDASPTDAAMALDIGSFPRLREMSIWIVKQCQAGTADSADIREVIYSPDGRVVKRFDRLGRQSGGDDSHLWHTHISYFRDSEDRDKAALFRRFLEGGAVANADETERTAFNGDAWGAGIFMLSPKVDIKTTAGVIKVDNQIKAELERIKAMIAALETPKVDLAGLAAEIIKQLRG